RLVVAVGSPEQERGLVVVRSDPGDRVLAELEPRDAPLARPVRAERPGETRRLERAVVPGPEVVELRGGPLARVVDRSVRADRRGPDPDEHGDACSDRECAVRSLAELHSAVDD